MSRVERIHNLRKTIEEEKWDVYVKLILQDYINETQITEVLEFKEEQIARKHLAAYKIQQWWLFVSSSPEYAVGRRRIEAGFDKEFGGEKN